MEKGNNWEPRVGQKVVAIVDGINNRQVKKGDVFTVLGVQKCCYWSVDIGLKIKREIQICSKCNEISGYRGGTCWIYSFCFAPIQPAYSDATAEILEKFQPCEGGSVDVPVKEVEEQVN